MDERLVANAEEFARRFAFPKLVPGRLEDFFRDLERRYATKIPVRRGDTGLYWETGRLDRRRVGPVPAPAHRPRR